MLSPLVENLNYRALIEVAQGCSPFKQRCQASFGAFIIPSVDTSQTSAASGPGDPNVGITWSRSCRSLRSIHRRNNKRTKRGLTTLFERRASLSHLNQCSVIQVLNQRRQHDD